MCRFDRIQRVNYFRREPIGKAEVGLRIGKLKNGKAAVKNEIIGEMIKSRDDSVGLNL